MKQETRKSCDKSKTLVIKVTRNSCNKQYFATHMQKIISNPCKKQ